ncbi:NAD(P)/FAD-dependent oxidoreductase [Mycolicibacterium gilvum]|uniref:Flavin-dependent dehydrogenase n=1 Tax=Mycolicibacterium gilvum (strain DSM 45189 / LMG 24558 / Spyr1) TaxID=278137 RepID=E6TFS7_MYCSR|nr:NAD(P)/FAD-dependent oxidoreductase [Mycolicibacterium gilvum]ADU01114.1 flavin-dependent dehydrogenase [Mycolicibacterium gilvum Spyr1]
MIDLVVAGGGPAGLATAIHAARAGLETVVIEQRTGPIDKACGEGLMPHAVRQLALLGAQPAGIAFRGISYFDADHAVTALFDSGHGLGVRRKTLHAALLTEADRAGVKLVHAKAGPLTQDADSVSVNGFRARYLAAADGLHSPIRARLGLELPTAGTKRWGLKRHIAVAPWSDMVEVYWSDDPGSGEAYVTPVAPDCVGIALLTSRQGGFDEHMAAFPELRDRIAGFAHEPDRAAGPLRQRVRRRVAGRVLLVGDAAGYVDALTGEGLGLAFAAARLLVDSVAADRPGDYEARWRRATRRYRVMTAGVLRAGTSPLRSVIVPAACRLPRVFRGVVNLLAQ